MALGNVTPQSDYDILVGVRTGKMFTARYAALALFTFLGMRRMNDVEDSNPDKLCFNHFVTPATYAKPPHNEYRRALYRNLVPLFGAPEAIARFSAANRWCVSGPLGHTAEYAHETWRHVERGPSGVRRFLESLFGGRLGEWVEKLGRAIATRRLRRYVKRHGVLSPAGGTGKGRVVISDAELEFHFNLRYEG